MKFKINFTYVFILMAFLISFNGNTQNIVGSWVISSDYIPDDSGYKNYKLDFSENGIINSTNPAVLNSNTAGYFSFLFAMGGYDVQSNLDTYITENYYYDNNLINNVSNDYNGGLRFQPQAQTIPSFDEEDEYVMVYSSGVSEGGTTHKYSLKYNVVSFDNTGTVFNEQDFLEVPNTVNEYRYATSILSNIVDGDRYAFVLFGHSLFNYSGDWGLKRIDLDNRTYSAADDLLVDIYDNDTHHHFLPKEYKAFEMEMQDKNNVDDPIIAWISYSGNSSVKNEKIYIYNEAVEDEHYFLDLSNINGIGTGRIAGIEFSPFPEETNFMYVSCENFGLIKINWTDGTLIEQYTSTSIDYSHSYVQTGPDGNVYVVSDDGTNFGMVSKIGNHSFYPAAFVYPEYNNSNFYSSHINYYQIEENGIKYYTLPENDNPNLHAIVNVSDQDCDYTNGEAVIQVAGGAADYTINVTTATGNNVTSLFTYDNINHTFSANNLPMGLYNFTITDSNEPNTTSYTSSFTISQLNPYDFTSNLLDINSNSASNINGLEDMVWDVNDDFESEGLLMFKYGFKLTGNTTLTINGLDVEFDQTFDAKVIIEPGSKLIINNSTLTNYHCSTTDAKWQGIEVWGNKGLSQTEANQGKLVLNNTTIEHADEAVQLWRPDYYSTSGGMISAINSNFLNNHRAVVFMDYKNMKFDLEWDYSSGFSQCTFENNSDYIMDNPFLAFVTMWKVRGVSFTACDFTNTSAFPESKAIYTLDAGYKFKGQCTGVTGPNGECVSGWETNTFTKFEKAIESGNTVGSPDPYAITIEDSYFENNHYGIYMTTVENAATILNNEFEIGNDGIDNFEKQKCSYFSARGIQMNQSFGFDIEENTFSKMQGTTGGDVVGVLVYECPSESDDIYKNIFNGLTAGNQAELWNRLNHLVDEHGVTYLCNENTNNTIDIFIAENSMITGHVGSLQEAAGNKFSTTNPQIQNNFTQEVNYYWVDEPYEELEYYSNYVTPIEVTNENECLSNFGSGGGTGLETKLILTDIEKLEVEQDFYSNYQDYEAVNILLEELKDGGSTETTSLSIASAQATDTWELRANLLGMSPYLSKEVLMEATDKTDVLPESVLFEILSANPDELRKTDLMEHLENKEQPLPDYMINVLKQMSTGVSAKTALIGQKTKSFVNKTKAAQTIIRSIKNEEELNIVELRNWLGNMGNIEADKQIVGTYLYEDNYTAANNLLNLIPNLYNLQGEKLQEFNDYKELLNLQVALKQQDRNVFMLNSTEKSQLIDLAENSNGEAKYGAQNILSFVYGDNYCDCISPINQNKASTSSFYYSQDDFAKAMGLSMDIKPNPATIYTSIDYTLPIGIEKAMLQLINVEGKTLHTENIDGVQGQITFDIRNHPNGTYLIKIQAGDYQLSETLIIQ